MPRRYLFGPVPGTFAKQNLAAQREAGACRAFNAEGDADLVIRSGDAWADVLARLPLDWLPDYVVLYLPYTTIPECLCSAPLPVVGLALDWRLLWHSYRRRLGDCDLVLADPEGAAALARDGFPHVHPALLCGTESSFHKLPASSAPRDVDVLVVGNLNPAVHPERVSLLPRLAKLGERWRVAFHPGVTGQAYRDLLARARIVVQQGAGGDGDRLIFEAPLSGALLFRAAAVGQGPDEVPQLPEWVSFTPTTLEPLLEQFLTDEDERVRRARAAGDAARGGRFDALWEGCATRIEEDWSVLEEARNPACSLHDRRATRPLLAGGRGPAARGPDVGSGPGGGGPDLSRVCCVAKRAGPRRLLGRPSPRRFRRRGCRGGPALPGRGGLLPGQPGRPAESG